MNILNTQVSYYPGPITDKSSTLTVALIDFIANPSPEIIAWVLKVRECKTKDERDAMKARVAWTTPSGIFNPGCTDKDLIKHSGIVCLDFDAKHNPGVDFAEVKRQVSRLSWVAACTWSVSGTGLVMYVPIKYPDKHHHHFDRLVDEFAAVGLKMDRSCRNVNRARYATFDPDPYINPAATIYAKVKEPKPITVKQRTNTVGTAGAVHTDIFRWARHVVETHAPGRTAYQFVEGQRHAYIFRFCCILNDYGVSKGDAEAWINANLIPLSEIRSNCIDGPYQRFPERFGCKSFTTSSTPSPTFRKPYTVMKRTDYITDQSVERKDWSEPTATTGQVSDGDCVVTSTDPAVDSYRIGPNPIVLEQPSTPRPLPEVDQLLTYFTANPGGPHKVGVNLNIEDPVRFLHAHTATITTYKGSRIATPYIDRLNQFRRYCGDNFGL